MPFLFQHIKGTVPMAFTVDVDLDHLTEVTFVRFLHCKVTLYLYPYFFFFVLRNDDCKEHMFPGMLFGLIHILKLLYSGYGS